MLGGGGSKTPSTAHLKQDCDYYEIVLTSEHLVELLARSLLLAASGRVGGRLSSPTPSAFNSFLDVLPQGLPADLAFKGSRAKKALSTQLASSCSLVGKPSKLRYDYLT